MVLVRYRDYLDVEPIVWNAHPLNTFLIIQNYPKLMSMYFYIYIYVMYIIIVKYKMYVLIYAMLFNI